MIKRFRTNAGHPSTLDLSRRRSSYLSSSIFLLCCLISVNGVEKNAPNQPQQQDSQQDQSVNPQLASLFKERSGHDVPNYVTHGGNGRGNNGLLLGNFSSRQGVESRAACDCGIQQYVPHRIFGGSETYPNEYPWMAALVFPPGSVTCGATLIGSRFALSAAHCFLIPVASIIVLLGTHDLRDVGPNAVTVPVRQVIRHPGFDRLTGDFDLAIVEFVFPVIFGPNVSPICLPFPNIDLTWQPVIVMGWGLTPYAPASYTLQEVTLSVIPNDLCQEQYASTGPLTENMICATGNGKDACRGDSGGPLIWNHEGRWFIAGVVSFGMECGLSTAAGVYSRVSRFLDWILAETENTACLAPPAVLTTAPYPYPWIITRRSPSSSPLAQSTATTSAGRGPSTPTRSG